MALGCRTVPQLVVLPEVVLPTHLRLIEQVEDGKKVAARRHRPRFRAAVALVEVDLGRFARRVRRAACCRSPAGATRIFGPAQATGVLAAALPGDQVLMRGKRWAFVRLKHVVAERIGRDVVALDLRLVSGDVAVERDALDAGGAFYLLQVEAVHLALQRPAWPRRRRRRVALRHERLVAMRWV